MYARSTLSFHSLAFCATFSIGKPSRECRSLKPEPSGLMCFFSLQTAGACCDCGKCETGDGQLINADQTEEWMDSERTAAGIERNTLCGTGRLPYLFSASVFFFPLFVFFLNDVSREQTAVRLSVPVSLEALVSLGLVLFTCSWNTTNNSVISIYCSRVLHAVENEVGGCFFFFFFVQHS